jgi:hypothetical protein
MVRRVSVFLDRKCTGHCRMCVLLKGEIQGFSWRYEEMRKKDCATIAESANSLPILFVLFLEKW